jgi:flagellar biosynthesis/type III secretory pathway chaperone
MNTAIAQTVFTGQGLIARLKSTLEEEFEVLKKGDTQELERLQSKKSELLENLTHLLHAGEPDAKNHAPEFLDHLEECKKMHRRNELFLKRKLYAVQSALQSLQIAQDDAIDQTYDRRGAIKASWLLNQYRS